MGLLRDEDGEPIMEQRFRDRIGRFTGEKFYFVWEDLPPVDERVEVVHACPPGQEMYMPCCGRTPFEVPPYHRMTLDPALVTCVPLTGPSEPSPVN